MSQQIESTLEFKEIDGKQLFRLSQYPEHIFEDGESALKWASDNNVSVKQLLVSDERLLGEFLCQS